MKDSRRQIRPEKKQWPIPSLTKDPLKESGQLASLWKEEWPTDSFSGSLQVLLT